MCGGGSGGGGGGADGGRGDHGGRAEARGFTTTGQRGEIAEGSTFNYADSSIGRFMGDTRTDQQIEDDVAVTEGLETGQKTVRGAGGRSINVSSYERDIATPSGGVLGRMNSAPTVGSILGSGISAVVGGPVGFVVGRLGGAVIDQTLGSRSQIPFDR